MGRYIRWQAILTLTGIALTMTYLTVLAMSRTTVTVPDVGGVYTEGIVGTPQFINPLLAQYNQVDQDLSALIFNGLTRMDGKGNVQPDLAASWQISADKRRYIFRLRNDVRWHDGQPFTADDALFTYSLMQDPDFPGVSYLSNLWRSVTVQKLDQYTIFFDLLEPSPVFIEFTTIGILPEHKLKNVPVRDLLNHSFNLNPIGTGPFELEEVNAELAHLASNPLYFRDQPRFGMLEFKFYPNHNNMIAAYQAGEIQAISRIPPQAVSAVRGFDSLNLYTALLSGYDIIYLNLQSPDTTPFFQDAGVRRALLQALDRQKIIDEALNGQGLVASGPILPWSWAHNPDQSVPGFDLANAKKLLDESGWIDEDGDSIREKDGSTLAFSLLSTNNPAKVRVANAVSEQWQKIGVLATVDVVGGGLGERLVQRNFQAALAEVIIAGDPDPYPFWHQTQIEGGQNYAGWDNTDASMLLELARSFQEQGQRNDYYFEFQRIFAEEVPSIILYHPTYTFGVDQEILGVQMTPMSNPSDRFRTISNWYTVSQEVIFTESHFDEVNP